MVSSSKLLNIGLTNSAICKSRNGESGNGTKGMQGMEVGMREIGVGMRGIRVGMRIFYQIRNIKLRYQCLMLMFSCNDPNQRYYLNGMWKYGPSVLILFR